MRTAGLKMTDVWAHRALQERDVETISTEGQAAEISVLVDSVALHHHGPARNYRPYLHLSGELRGVNLEQPLAFDIRSVTYDSGRGEKVDAFYEFDDEQLLALTTKGYFDEGFVVPEQITGIEWELPASVDTLLLAPRSTLALEQDDPPVVFVRVHDIANLQVSLASCGYDLVDEFAAQPGRQHPQPVVDNPRGARSRSDELNSLFEGELVLDADQANSAHRRAPQKLATTDPQGLQADLSAAEAELEAQRVHLEEQRSVVVGSNEQLYADRVATTLRQQESEAADSTPTESPTSPGAHDLDLDDVGVRAGAKDAQASRTSLQERKRELSAKVADLDHGDDGAESGMDR